MFYIKDKKVCSRHFDDCRSSDDHNSNNSHYQQLLTLMSHHKHLLVQVTLFPTSPMVYSSGTGGYQISNSLTERGPTFLNIHNGRNGMGYGCPKYISKLYPIVDLCKQLPDVALPPPIPLDFPTMNLSRKVNSSTSHPWAVREQPLSTGTVPGNVFSSTQKVWTMASVNQKQLQTPPSQSMEFSDPVIVL